MKTNRLTVAVTLSVLLATSAFAQRPTRRFPPGFRRPTTQKTEPKKEETAKKKAGPITAIVGGDIYTVSRGVIRKGVLLIQDGKILDVGQDLETPKGAKVVDAKGHFVTPGFVTMNMSRVALTSTSSSRISFANRGWP